MHKHSRSAALTLAVLMALCAGTAQADRDDDDDDDKRRDETKEELRSITYSAIGLSRMAVDIEGFDYKEAVSIDAIVIGLRLPNVQTFGVEVDANFTIIPGEFEPRSTTSCTPNPVPGGAPICSTNRQAQRDDFQAFNLGVYAVARTPGKLFAMGKIGYRYTNTSLDGEGEGFIEERTGTAWAAGAGYRYNERGGFAELVYQKLSDEIDTVGFSIGYGFGARD